jgi:hypothetical protein
VPTARVGFFALDQQLERGEGVWGPKGAPGLAGAAVYVRAAVPSFELAQSILPRVGQIELSQASLWRGTQAAGERFQALERERANALPEAWQPPSRGSRPTDGGGVGRGDAARARRRLGPRGHPGQTRLHL